MDTKLGRRDVEALGGLSWTTTVDDALDGITDADALAWSVARLLVPRLADGCRVSVLAGDGAGGHQIATADVASPSDESCAALRVNLAAGGRIVGTMELLLLRSVRRAFGAVERAELSALSHRAAMAIHLGRRSAPVISMRSWRVPPKTLTPTPSS